MLNLFVRKKRVFAEVLQKLLNEKEYSFGKPWQLISESLSAALPILQNTLGSRDYVVAQEIPENSVNILDTGQIQKLRVNAADLITPVFVRAGTIFKGHGTQSRTVSIGMCLEPGRENTVDVLCVHATHGISANSHFSMERDVAPRKVEEVLTSQNKNQSRVWAAACLRKSAPQITQCPECGSKRIMQTYDADRVCMDCGITVFGVLNRFADNMVANLYEMNAFNKRIEDVLSKVPADLEKQVGVVIIDVKGVCGLEMFDHPDSWRAFSKSIVRNYADILAKGRAEKEGLFALKVEKIAAEIEEFLRKATDLCENSVFKNDISETWALSGELVGEYSVLGRHLVHVMLKRN